MNTPEAPLHSETEQPLHYDALADSVIATAEQRNPLQQLVLMQEFVQQVEKDAFEGSILSSKKEVYSLETIQDQLKTLGEEMNRPSGRYENPLLLIPSSNGLRAAFARLLDNPTTAKPLMDALNGNFDSIMASVQENEKLPSTEALNMPTVRADLAEQAISAVGVEASDITLSELPSAARIEVIDYQEEVRQKLAAEKDKDFVAAKEHGQEMYRLSQKLSADARRYLGFPVEQ